jgi:predicted Zn-dependent protease
MLPNSRSNETEADLIGMELAARAGYAPEAAVSLWQKMAAASQGAPPEFLSTHPSSGGRIETLRATIPRVQPLYNASRKR